MKPITTFDRRIPKNVRLVRSQSILTRNVFFVLVAAVFVAVVVLITAVVGVYVVAAVVALSAVYVVIADFVVLADDIYC